MVDSRLRWMDLLRGSAIILVLLWHAPAVPVIYGFEMPTWIRTANDFFLPFRMPMLMFLSGTLLSRSLTRPLPEYLLGKIALIGWPYIVWAALHIVQSTDDLSLTSPRAWLATGYLWFLFFIGTYYCVAPFIRWVPSWLVSIVAFGVSVPLDGELVKGFFYFLGFFYAGHFFTENRDASSWVSRRSAVAVCAVLALGVGVWSSLNGADSKYEAWTAPASLAGIIVAMRVSQGLPDTAVGRFVESVGRSSLIYYVSHFPLIIVTTILLSASGVQSFTIVTVSAFTTALGFGFAMTLLSRHAPARWLFQMPGFEPIRRKLRALDTSRRHSKDTMTP